MELNAIRIVADWLAGKVDPAAGVNRLLWDVPLDKGDSKPLLLTGVYAETDYAELAHGVVPAGVKPPLLIVALGGDVEYDGEITTVEQNARIPIMVGFVGGDDAREAPDAKTAHHRFVTLRAVRRSLCLLNQNEAEAPELRARTRNGIQLLDCTSMRTIVPTPEQRALYGGLAFLSTWNARDFQPYPNSVSE